MKTAMPRTLLTAVCAALISHAYVAGPVFSLALLAVVPVVAGIFSSDGFLGLVARSLAAHFAGSQ